MPDPPTPFSRLLRELKRRKVFRVAVVYAATAFVVVQAASFVFPALLLPDVVFRALVVLALFGFPIALVLAWAFEVTPDGIRRTRAPQGREGGPRPWAWVGLGALVALAGVGAYRAAAPGAGGAGGEGPDTGPAAAAGGVGAHEDAVETGAVLPFHDMSAESDQQYFGDGLAEEIIDALTRVPGLRVSSRTSSFRFRGSRVDPRAIADTLGVDALVEGSVRQAGDRLRVTAQLIDADDAFHRWSRTFERELTADNLFDVQAEIARGVAAEMRREAVPRGGDRRLVRRPGMELETYRLYLRARYHWNRRTPGELATAIRLYRRAIERDSGFARAWAGLAGAYAVPTAPIPPSRSLPLAKEAARRALALDSTLAPAHTALAYALMSHDWDWEGARRSFLRAIELDPGYATAHQWYGEWLAARGRTGEGVAAMRRAEELEPLSMIIVWNVARGLYFDRRYEEAAVQVEKLRELFPDGRDADRTMAAIAWMRGREEAALEHWLAGVPTEARATVRDSLADGGMAALIRQVRRWAEAQAASVDDSLPRPGPEELESVVTLYAVPAWAMIEAGHEEKLLDVLERAVEARDLGGLTVDLATDPAYDPIRSHPRYRALLRRVNLAP